MRLDEPRQGGWLLGKRGQRRKRGADAFGKPCRALPFVPVQTRPRILRMKRDSALIFDGASEAFGSRGGPRPAQDCLFQGVDRPRLAGKTRERMTKEGKQRDGSEPFGGGRRNKPRQPAGLGLRERHAGGIVDRDVPAGEFGGDPPRQRTI